MSASKSKKIAAHFRENAQAPWLAIYMKESSLVLFHGICSLGLGLSFVCFQEKLAALRVFENILEELLKSSLAP